MAEHKRIQLSELEDSIFRPNEIDPSEQIAQDPSVVVYTIIGKQDELDGDGFPILHDTLYERAGKETVVKAGDFEEAYAKKEFNGSSYTYYAKSNKRGNLYNPYGLYEEWNHTKSREGEPIWKFVQINIRVFELYISFLKTNNKSWLLNAERAHR